MHTLVLLHFGKDINVTAVISAYYELKYVPPPLAKLVGSPQTQDLRIWVYLEMGLERGKLRSLA